MTDEEINTAGEVALEAIRTLATEASSRNYWFTQTQSVQSRLRETRAERDKAIQGGLATAAERDTLKEELTRCREEKRQPSEINGKTIDYWFEIASSSVGRNDDIITKLREKEKLNADLEQQLNSAETAAAVYVRTINDLEVDRDKWKRIAGDEREGREAVQSELDNTLLELTQQTARMDALRAENQKLREAAEKTAEPVAGNEEDPFQYVYEDKTGVQLEVTKPVMEALHQDAKAYEHHFSIEFDDNVFTFRFK